MKFWRLSFVALCLVLAPVLANAVCSGFFNITPDGRITGDFSIPASTAETWFFIPSSGHSYSVEVDPPLDAWNNAPLQLFINNTAGGDCSLSDTGVTTRDTTNIDPNPAGGSTNVSRKSFTVTSSNGFLYVVVNNTDTNAHTFHITVSETTLFNTTWSTFSPFITEWGFMNTTNATINGLLTVTDSISGGPYTKSFSVQPGKVLFMTTNSTFTGGPIPASHNGGAFATHDGPPGALLPLAFILKPDGTVVFPAVFQPVRENGH